MPWGELKKEDLIKAGLDPDAFKAANDKIDKAASKDDVAELKSTLATTQQTLKDLEASLRTITERKPAGENGNEGGDGKPKEPVKTGPLQIDPLEFMEDPQGAVRKIMSEGLYPVTLHSLSVAADMAYNMAKQQLPHFDKFEPEIKELWDKYTPQQKGKPGELIENIYNLVRGRHLDDILTDTAKKEGKFNLVQSGGTSVIRSAGGPSGKDDKPEDLLTPKELEVAAKFGLSPKEWAEQKGGLKYV
jgi:hypothetical protein